MLLHIHCMTIEHLKMCLNVYFFAMDCLEVEVDVQRLREMENELEGEDME